MKKESIKTKIIKRFMLLIVLLFCMFNAYALNETNVTNLGHNQVDYDNPLYVNFSILGTTILFVVIFIITVLSFVVIIHIINSLVLLFLSVILIANGFNPLVSFILMLISIGLLSIATRK